MKTRILLADDHKMMRDGLRTLIERKPELEVVGEADNGRAAVDLARKLSPNVVVMDIGMPELNGIEATRHITHSVPGAKVIALSMHADRRFVAGILRAGAAGYLLKDSAFEELVTAIRKVLAGRTYFSAEIARIVTDDYVSYLKADESSAFSVLSPREREVLQPLVEGRTTKEVALRLKVSVKTVHTHRENIMSKLSIYNMPELTKYAIREGLTTIDA